MTRWARANNIHKHKPADATPWDQLKHPAESGAKRRFPASSRGGPRNEGTSADSALRRTQRQGPADYKKPNKKKKDYDNVDVNGFMEYLQKSGLPRGQQDGEQGLREEVETALRKDSRREERRIKRQTDKKNKMVRVVEICVSLTVLSTNPLGDKQSVFPLVLPHSSALTAGSRAMGWPTVQRRSGTWRWAGGSASAAAPPNMRSRGAEPRWTLLWVRGTSVHTVQHTPLAHWLEVSSFLIFVVVVVTIGSHSRQDAQKMLGD